MTSLILLILSGLIIWLFVKVSDQARQISSLTEWTDYLKDELHSLKDRFSERPHAGETKPVETKEKHEESPQAAAPIDHAKLRAAVEHKMPKTTPPPIPKLISKADASRPVEPATPPEKKSIPRKEAASPAREINWENFLGAKLFAWIGGLSLFIGFAFLLKYSFDRNLISPAVRVAMGFICGLGLVVGGVQLKRKTYSITAQTLCASGIVILYASSFAAHALYQFFGITFTFILMSGITTGAFVLAVGMEAVVVAVLGLVGGFLTPMLLSTGQDQPLALFAYVTFLNLGLLTVAFARRWDFLTALGAAGTVLMQVAWTAQFFAPEKIFVAMGIFFWFDLLFLGAFWIGIKRRWTNPWLSASAAALPFVTLAFTYYLLSNSSISARPGVLFSFLLVADLCLLAIALLRHELQKIHLAAGGFVFFILSTWTAFRLTSGLLSWALGGYLVFALLHSVFPLMMSRMRPGAGSKWQPQVFPVVTLVLMLLPILKDLGGDWIIWPFVLLINALILFIAFLTMSVVAILAGVVVSAIVVLGWIFNLPSETADWGGLLSIVGVYGVFFSLGATFLLSRMRERLAKAEGGSSISESSLFGDFVTENLFVQIPAFSLVLPFILLILASSRLSLQNPSPILGLGLFLTFVAFGLVRYLRAPALLPISLACAFVLEGVVHLRHFNPENAPIFLAFNTLFLAIFFSLPFLFRKDYLETAIPWASAALSGPLQFLLIYDVVRRAYPTDFMGLLPTVLAIPFLWGLKFLIQIIPGQAAVRKSIFAWFGGAALFFITLIFPIQFEHEWLTVGWALEGVALLWLFHKIPHPGLRGLGLGLLLATFARLALNPAVLSYHSPGAFPILNWYLYTYGIGTVCLMLGARLLAPPRNRVWEINAPPILYSLGAVLGFLLMNIEIADFFSTGPALTFEFSGNLARGMTYSIAWGAFALGLLIVGIWKRQRPARLAAIGLLGVTLGKLFLFDLSQLDQLYRIGAFIGVAVILIVASFLYQKYLNPSNPLPASTGGK